MGHPGIDLKIGIPEPVGDAFPVGVVLGICFRVLLFQQVIIGTLFEPQTGRLTVDKNFDFLVEGQLVDAAAESYAVICGVDLHPEGKLAFGPSPGIRKGFDEVAFIGRRVGLEAVAFARERESMGFF